MLKHIPPKKIKNDDNDNMNSNIEIESRAPKINVFNLCLCIYIFSISTNLHILLLSSHIITYYHILSHSCLVASTHTPHTLRKASLHAIYTPTAILQPIYLILFII